MKIENRSDFDKAVVQGCGFSLTKEGVLETISPMQLKIQTAEEKLKMLSASGRTSIFERKKILAEKMFVILTQGTGLPAGDAAAAVHSAGERSSTQDIARAVYDQLLGSSLGTSENFSCSNPMVKLRYGNHMAALKLRHPELSASVLERLITTMLDSTPRNTCFKDLGFVEKPGSSSSQEEAKLQFLLELLERSAVKILQELGFDSAMSGIIPEDSPFINAVRKGLNTTFARQNGPDSEFDHINADQIHATFLADAERGALETINCTVPSRTPTGKYHGDIKDEQTRHNPSYEATYETLRDTIKSPVFWPFLTYVSCQAGLVGAACCPEWEGGEPEYDLEEYPRPLLPPGGHIQAGGGHWTVFGDLFTFTQFANLGIMTTHPVTEDPVSIPLQQMKLTLSVDMSQDMSERTIPEYKLSPAVLSAVFLKSSQRTAAAAAAAAEVAAAASLRAAAVAADSAAAATLKVPASIEDVDLFVAAADEALAAADVALFAARASLKAVSEAESGTQEPAGAETPEDSGEAEGAVGFS